MSHPPMPTAEQCTKRERLQDWHELACHAIWYPQMGGYVAKAVIIFSKKGGTSNCFEAYIWHDGEFPFTEDEGNKVAHVHHCSANQFVSFGCDVRRMQQKDYTND